MTDKKKTIQTNNDNDLKFRNKDKETGDNNDVQQLQEWGKEVPNDKVELFTE